MDFDSRPSSGASAKIKRVLSIEQDVSKSWESGIVCGDLKVMNWKDRDHYLIAKNCGEVLCCKKILGAVKVNKFGVTSKTFFNLLKKRDIFRNIVALNASDFVTLKFDKKLGINALVFELKLLRSA